MRKDIPYQELIPLNQGIAIVNAQKWFPDLLKIHYYSANGSEKEVSYDSQGICLIQGLVNGEEYTVEISRTDLKGRFLYKKLKQIVKPQAEGVQYLVLVGASVGKAWEFENLPFRLGLGPNIIFGNRTIYDFDKSAAIKQLAEIPVPVTGVIIKECAAYFPRDIENSKNRVIDWVQMLREHNRRPILATVVPVTKEHDKDHPGRFNSLLEYNDFIRKYAQDEKIDLVDLEKAVRISSSDRHLRDDYATEDGLHLVEKAYREALDAMPLPIDR